MYILKVVSCANEYEVTNVMDNTFLMKKIAHNCPYMVSIDDCFYHRVDWLPQIQTQNLPAHTRKRNYPPRNTPIGTYLLFGVDLKCKI